MGVLKYQPPCASDRRETLGFDEAIFGVLARSSSLFVSAKGAPVQRPFRPPFWVFRGITHLIRQGWLAASLEDA